MSPHAHRGPPPESLKLRKHLEMSTQPELDEFRRFWAPHDQAETTREALVDRLARITI